MITDRNGEPISVGDRLRWRTVNLYATGVVSLNKDGKARVTMDDGHSFRLRDIITDVEKL